MVGPRKPSAKGGATTKTKRGAADNAIRNEDPEVKKELDIDSDVNLASLNNKSGQLIPVGQPLKASRDPSTPGHGMSSSPMLPVSGQSGQLVHPPGRKKGAALILWDFDENPVPFKGNNNGRRNGRNLIHWGRPRMYEKLLLHLQYEMNRHDAPIPWDLVAHRFHPGSSGQAVMQHLNRLRSTLLAEGHLVPPICQKQGSKKPVPIEIRGYIRAYPEGNDCVSARPVRWSEPVFDRQFNLPNAHNDRSLTGSEKRYHMGGEYVYPTRKRKPGPANMGVTESAKKTRQTLSKASTAASYAPHDDDETEVEQGDDHDEGLPGYWITDEDGNGEFVEDEGDQEPFLSPEPKVPVLDYNKTSRYPDPLIDDDDDEDADLQLAIKLSREDISKPVYHPPTTAATAMSSTVPPPPTNPTQTTLDGGVKAKLAFYKKQVEIYLRERQANAARHEVELTQARLDGEKHGIVIGFNMARQYPALQQPPSFGLDTLESPDTKLSNTMRVTSMVGHGHAGQPIRNPPATPASHRNRMLTLTGSYSQPSPTPTSSSIIHAKPLTGSARGSGSRSMHSGTQHGQIHPMLQQHDISYHSANAYDQNLSNSPSIMFSGLSEVSGGSFFDSGVRMNNAMQVSPMLSTMSSQASTENTQPSNSMAVGNVDEDFKTGFDGSGGYGDNHAGIVHGSTGDLQVSSSPLMDAMAASSEIPENMFIHPNVGYSFDQ